MPANTDHVTWDDALDRIGPDPLMILRPTAAVMRSARDVRIDPGAVAAVAERLIDTDPQPEWDADLHYRASGPDAVERTAMWIFVLDALNFCFWGQGMDPSVRWRVEWNGELTDGYMALAAALKRGVEEGIPLHDAEWLATVSPEEVADLLRPAEGHPDIPLFGARVDHLRELGRGLRALDSDTPAIDLISAAKGSAISLIGEIVRRFPSFNDGVTWPYSDTGLPDNEVRFYKRAQILAGDLAGALEGTPVGALDDLDQLTAFADYKVPQVLRGLGILRYSDRLAATIADRRHIEAGTGPEIEIRAATIWGCELLRQALAQRGRNIPAHELDWMLWEQGQSLPPDTPPYHLTPTIYY